MEIHITLNRKNFQEILNILVCRDRKMLVVVEGRRPCCWSCGVSRHMAKECTGKNVQSPPHLASTTAARAAVQAEEGTSKMDGAWKEVTKGQKASNVLSPPPKKKRYQKQRGNHHQRSRRRCRHKRRCSNQKRGNKDGRNKSSSSSNSSNNIERSSSNR